MQAASSRKKGSRGTSWHRRARCRATLTAGNAGRIVPQEGIVQDFLSSPGDMPGDLDGREFRPPRPARRDRAGLLVVAWRNARRRCRPGMQAASSRKKGRHGTCYRRWPTRWAKSTSGKVCRSESQQVPTRGFNMSKQYHFVASKPTRESMSHGGLVPLQWRMTVDGLNPRPLEFEDERIPLNHR